MARSDVGLCVLTVLLQLLYVCQCYDGGRKLEVPKRALSSADSNVLRSYLVHRDSLETGSNMTASEIFLEAVKRSQRRVTQMEKNLQLTAAGVETKAAVGLESPVTSSGGEYVMQVSLGTPPQKFITIVDTGSDLNWVQCSPCTRCFEQPDALFNPKASSTYSQAGCTTSLCRALQRPGCSSASKCTYTYSYGDGSSTRGDLAFDTITLGSSAVPHVGIGCGHNNQGSFAGADGLIGLGQGTLSLPSQLSPAVAKIFSYCLVDRLTTDSSPITFGNAPQNSNVKYTPLVKNANNPTFYYVGVTGVTVGGRAVTIPASAFQIASDSSGGVILDSGTTITYLKPAALNPILAALRQQIKYPEKNASPYGLKLCYDVSSVSDASTLTFPSMVLRMTNVDYAIPSKNLFVPADNTGQTWCLAMGSTDSLSIIGNIQQQNILIVHDVVNQRIGFQTTQCDTM